MVATTQLPSTELTSFCMQCEQTRDVKGCSASTGVCGKTPEVSALQDLFIYQLQGISAYARGAREIAGLSDKEVDGFILDGMFSTLTNVNFSHSYFEKQIKAGQKVRDQAKALYEKACKDKGTTPKAMGAASLLSVSGCSREDMEQMGLSVGVLARKEHIGDDDKHGLAEMCLYGLKGTMAYADHARHLGKENEGLYLELLEAMDELTRTKEHSLDDMLALALKIGGSNLKAMELLDSGHTDHFGHPTPGKARMSGKAGKAILVSGHDLVDLEEILKRTAGTGINVYTHGEMLPAHGYPKLREYENLAGHYGGPWQLQKFEFSKFPGPVVMTSNCIVEPQKKYRDRIWTRRFVGWEGVPNLENFDEFDDVIQSALASPGFAKDEPESYVDVGFAHNTVLSLAETVISAVKSGDIKRFFVIGGCDGAEGERSYFRDLAMGLPEDAVILTMGCGKYRFNRNTFAPTKGGVPRLLDLGQCNDAYSAVVIASALAKAFDTDVNSLPISFAVSWFEQKAVAVLLTLLHLDIKNIYLGPHLPAFATPNILNALISKYGIRGINHESYDSDLKQMLAGK